MAPFYSASLIGSQFVRGGRTAGCHVSCLILCAALSWRETISHVDAPFDHSVTGDTGESGLLIVLLRPGCIEVAMIHRRRRAKDGSYVWQLHKSTLIR